MARYVRCKASHPLVKKLEKLFDSMREAHISISVCPDSSHISVSWEGSGTEYRLLDLEDSADEPRRPIELPPELEWKLVFEKENEVKRE